MTTQIPTPWNNCCSNCQQIACNCQLFQMLPQFLGATSPKAMPLCRGPTFQWEYNDLDFWPNQNSSEGPWVPEFPWWSANPAAGPTVRFHFSSPSDPSLPQMLIPGTPGYTSVHYTSPQNLPPRGINLWHSHNSISRRWNSLFEATLSQDFHP